MKSSQNKSVADYKEGIFVGYRHFDKENIEPQFPFGLGLSYTSFEYSDHKIGKSHLRFYNTPSKRWVAEPGRFEVLIGSSSRDIRMTQPFNLKQI